MKYIEEASPKTNLREFSFFCFRKYTFPFALIVFFIGMGMYYVDTAITDDFGRILTIEDFGLFNVFLYFIPVPLLFWYVISLKVMHLKLLDIISLRSINKLYVCAIIFASIGLIIPSILFTCSYCYVITATIFGFFISFMVAYPLIEKFWW